MEKATPIDEEYFFDDLIVISQTDTDGVITYVNNAFIKVSGYTREELTGTSHNLIRHPDMPKALFEKMWSTIEGSQAWNGLIKNLRKDGKYYWVEAEILPIKDNEGKITAYICAQRSASRKDIHDTQETYNKMLEAENTKG